MLMQRNRGFDDDRKKCCDFTWKIEDFSRLPWGEVIKVISSAKFNINGLSGQWWFTCGQWCNPVGALQSEEQFGITLEFLSQGNPPLVVWFTLTMIGVKSNNKYICSGECFSHDYSCYSFSHHLSREEIRNESEVYLPGDTLTIECSIVALPDTPKLFSGDFLCRGLKQMLSSAEGSDFKLKVGGEDIPVHKFMLSAFSPVLKAMLQHDMLESRSNCLEITDLSFKAVRKLVEFMYAGEVDVEDPETAAGIFEAAHKYDVGKLQELCIQYLRRNIEASSVCCILRLADLYSCEVLLKEAKYFAVRNYLKVTLTEEWKAMCSDYPNLVKEVYSSSLK